MSLRSQDHNEPPNPTPDHDDFLRQPETVRLLFIIWHTRSLRASNAHYKTAELYGARETSLTVANLVFAITVLFLSAIYQSPPSDVEPSIIFGAEVYKLIPWASLFTVLTATLQYLLQLGSKSRDHKAAAMDFAGLRRKMERYWSKAELHEEAVHALSRTYNYIAKTAPIVPRRTWKESLEESRQEAKFIEESFFRSTAIPRILRDMKPG